MGKRAIRSTGGDGIIENSSQKKLRVSEMSKLDKAVDPTLALLFSTSSGPVQAPTRAKQEKNISVDVSDNKSALDKDTEESLDAKQDELQTRGDQSDPEDAVDATSESTQPRKRRRKDNDDDIEGDYMRRLAVQEEQEEEQRVRDRREKRRKLEPDPKSAGDADAGDIIDADTSGVEESAQDSEEEDALSPSPIPQHESLVKDRGTSALEKSSRTVFLANVSTSAIIEKKAKRTLLEHMSNFTDSAGESISDKDAYKIESIRFRSTAYAGNGLPKKAAFAKKELMSATTKSTNAYVVYASAAAAREAVKQLNASMVLDRHLRVDSVAHPAPIDHRRCVFVGNLGFVDDESMLDQGGETERKRSKIPSDIEEGLWRQFNKAGEVESVRVIRDEKTRVGKGFAYVQFKNANSVEAALLFNEKKYPPMLPRKLRVTRAKAVRKTASASQPAKTSSRVGQKPGTKPNHAKVYNPKISSEKQTFKGRAGKLLGKAGAAQLRKGSNGVVRSRPPSRGASQLGNIAKSPEDIIFEGHRASAKSDKPRDLKLTRRAPGKKSVKPRTRSSKRASEWKKGGGGRKAASH